MINAMLKALIVSIAALAGLVACAESADAMNPPGARPVRTAIGCTRLPGRRFGVRGFPAGNPTQNACGPRRKRK